MGRMKVADPSNFEAVSERYSAQEPNAELMDKLLSAASYVYNPTVIASPETKQQISSHTKKGGLLALVMKHTSWHDPFIAASVVKKTEELAPINGNVKIPAKAKIFDWPVAGPILDRIGVAVPVMRQKDIYGKDVLPSSEDDENRRKSANKAQLRIMADAVNNGSNFAVFPEGTLGPKDQSLLEPLRNGLFYILEAIDEPRRMMIVRLTMNYKRRFDTGSKSFWLPKDSLVLLNAMNPEASEGLTPHSLAEAMRSDIEHLKTLRNAAS